MALEGARRSWRTSAALAALLAASLAVRAQEAASVSLGRAAAPAVFNALAQECYEAGLLAAMPSDAILDCSVVLEERVLGERDGEPLDRVVTRLKLRFTLIAGAGRIASEAWTETDELGTVIEAPIASGEYLQRVQAVLAAVVARLNDPGAPPWEGRYESEQAWQLDAHLKAVAHCDARLAGMTAASVAAELESIGLRPLHRDVRDRCEQLYTHLYEWGLARGDAEPTLEEYARQRAALPAERRTCSGQLAPDATCRR